MLSQIIPLGNLKGTLPKISPPGKKKAESRFERIRRKGGGNQASNQERKQRRNLNGLSKYA